MSFANTILTCYCILCVSSNHACQYSSTLICSQFANTCLILHFAIICCAKKNLPPTFLLIHCITWMHFFSTCSLFEFICCNWVRDTDLSHDNILKTKTAPWRGLVKKSVITSSIRQNSTSNTPCWTKFIVLIYDCFHFIMLTLQK